MCIISQLSLPSALIFAANNGHLPLLKKLLEMGADIEDRANSWKTPLLCASQWGHYDVVVHLVENGANISVYDSSGLTPLMSATLGGHTTIVRYLLAKGASPTTVNFMNGTALSIAKARGHVELVELLQPFFPTDLEENTYYIMYQLIQRNVIFYSKLIAKQAKEVAIEFWTALNSPEAAKVDPDTTEGFSLWSEAQDELYSQRLNDGLEGDTKTLLKKQQTEEEKWDL